jgi:hypothetical protein
VWVKENGSDAILTFYIPTHRDEAAMNGAPDLLWLVERKEATARTEADPYGMTNKRAYDVQAESGAIMRE